MMTTTPRLDRSPITLNQLVITSSLYAMSGKGFGPVGKSSAWPFRTATDRAGGLRGLVNYSREAGAPPSLSVRRAPDGALCVLAKTAAGTDYTNRPGRYVVHALLDSTGQLHPRQAMSSVMSKSLIRDWPTSGQIDTDLPNVELSAQDNPKLPDPLHPRTSRQLPVLIDAVLGWIDGGGAMSLHTDDVEHAAELIKAMFLALPPALTANITFSTFEEEEAEDVVLLTAVDGFTNRVGARVVVDATTQGASDASTEPPSELARQLAFALLEGHELPPSSIVNKAQLEGWASQHRNAGQDPATLSVDELETILAGPYEAAQRWLNQHDNAIGAIVDKIYTTDNRRLTDLLRSVAPLDEQAKLVEYALQITRKNYQDPVMLATSKMLYDTFGGDPRRYQAMTVADLTDLLDRGALPATAASLLIGSLKSEVEQWPLSRLLALLELTQPTTHPARPQKPYEWSAWSAARLARYLLGQGELDPAEASFLLTEASPQAANLITQLLTDVSDSERAELAEAFVDKLAAIGPHLRLETIDLVLECAAMPREMIYPKLFADLEARRRQELFRATLPEMLALFGFPADVAENLAGQGQLRRETPSTWQRILSGMRA